MKTIFYSLTVFTCLLLVVHTTLAQTTFLSIQQNHFEQNSYDDIKKQFYFSMPYNYLQSTSKLSDSTNKYKLDSVYYCTFNTVSRPDSFPRMKEINNYNSNGNLASTTIYYIPLGTRKWVPQTKRCFNDDGSEFARYSWNNEKWYILFKHTRSYNPQTNETTYETYETDENFDSICAYKYVRKINSALQNEIYTAYYYDRDTKKLEFNYKAEFFYNIDFTQFTNIYYYNWNTKLNTWVYDYKVDYDTTNNDLISSVRFIYDTKNGVWNKNSREIIKLDSASNREITSESFIFDTITNNWITDQSSAFFYDKFGKDSIQCYKSYSSGELQRITNFLYINTENHCIKYEYTRWDTINGWYGIQKYDSLFNNAEKDTCVIKYSWDTITNNWAFTHKKYSEYNDDNLPATFYFQEWDNNSGIWADVEKRNYEYSDVSSSYTEVIFKWDTISANWLLTDKLFYYYSSFTNSIETQLYNNQLIKVYPNPATTNVTIVNNAPTPLTANIYDIYGQLVSTTPIAIGKNSLNVSNLSKGIYFISANGLGKTIKLYKQ